MRVRLSRILWIGAAAILVAAALVAVVAVLRSDFSDTDGRILGTLAAALLAGSTLVAGLALAERGARALGWAAVAVSGPAFAAITYSIWDFVFDGEGQTWRWGWAGILALLAALIAVTARLLARSRMLVRLAWVAGALATIAAAVSYVAIWSDDSGDSLGRVIAVLWILAGLAYLLVPVLQRFTAAGAQPGGERVVAELDGVEVVATRSHDGLAVDVLPGERLVLRRRAQRGAVTCDR
jgi:hypothetical protein